MPRSITRVVSLLVGVAVFGLSLPFGILEPGAVGWMFVGGLDPSGHFLGWHMFRHDAWHWPPGAIANFGHPIGTSIALTDSVPLVAVPLKVADAILPPVFQYMGLWLLACYMLQAFFGALLVATATPSATLQLLGAAFFALSPVLLNRIGHQALCAHWLLLAALWLYARCAIDGAPRLAGWVVLTCAVAATHPYLTVQVLPVAVAAALAGSRGVSRLPAGAMRLVLLGATTTAVWWLAGYFVVESAEDLQQGGFGRLSLNLAAPFIAPPGAWLEGRLGLAGLAHEQLEGYSYLGLGGLVLLAIALATLRWGPLRRFVSEHSFVLLACLGLTLLAASHTITFGTRVLAEYDAAWWGPLAVFRSSGRVFWIVYYAILFTGLTALVKGLRAPWATLALIAIVSLQAADMAGPRRTSRTMRSQQTESPLRSELWETVAPHYRHLVLHPTNMCAAEPGIDYRFLAVLAGHAGATINAGYAGRYDAARLRAYCQDLEATLATGAVDDDTLYVVTPAEVPRILSFSVPMACTPLDAYAICVTANSATRWRGQ